MPLVCYPVSALEKVFLDEAPKPLGAGQDLSALKGELLSFQIALLLTPPSSEPRRLVWVDVDCPLPWTIRRVEQVPVRLPCPPGADEDYLRRLPGLYPDALMPFSLHQPLPLYCGQWSALWVDVTLGPEAAAGTCRFAIRLRDEMGGMLGETGQTIEVIDALLPAQTLIHARWLHADALADAYGVPMFSQRHFEILTRWITLAAARGINMMLVPIHTPPLDTRRGGERRTAQLVEVFLEKGEYSFRFDKLRRYLAICEEAGIRYYEMAHLFTQWGARHPPKIMATVAGEQVQLFGWQNDALGPDYRAFLAAYLPALVQELRRLGLADRCRFHISDEPDASQIGQYRAAKALAAPYLQGFPIMDALSDFSFYLDGTVAHPIPSLDHLEPFLQAEVPDLWTYYCLGQSRQVSNTFIAMPSGRTRILGLQLYLCRIKGFLQWAFNFYYAQYADYYVDPWHSTEADGFGPAGDAFQVYPGQGGEPVESLRLMVFFHGLQDLRALQALEAALGREAVLRLIGEGLPGLPTLRDYPRDPAYLLDLRRRVNRALGEAAHRNA
ncbi:MAG: DUF4091 domain-containing protein [Christensenellales bacterium]